MSSDYITRLRGELLRAAAGSEAPRRSREHAGDAREGGAGAAGGARRGGAGTAGGARRGTRARPATRALAARARRATHAVARPVTSGRRAHRAARRPSTRTVKRLRPLAGLVALALVIAAVVFTLPRDRADDVAVPPAGTQRLDDRLSPAKADAIVKILQERLDLAEIRDARTMIVGGEIRVAAPTDAMADITALMEPGRFGIYYWEGSVLGPDGEPAPGEPDVTGGQDAGRAAAVTKAEAQERAKAGTDARVVRAESGDGYFALEGAPAITNSGLADARPRSTSQTQRADRRARASPTTGQRAFQDLTRERRAGRRRPRPRPATRS